MSALKVSKHGFSSLIASAAQASWSSAGANVTSARGESISWESSGNQLENRSPLKRNSWPKRVANIDERGLYADQGVQKRTQ